MISTSPIRRCLRPIRRDASACTPGSSDLDECVVAHEWLAGDAFSLADLAWSIDIYRFELIKLPIERYAAMLTWYRRIESRPGFQHMVLDYEAQFWKLIEAPKIGAA